ncbi:unnamed protein product [Tuber melanosporum]|uniref:(Perigord truffle) hypothetical protein n=1 Tax=Tuber melanosporum (strain Mel28) TaxID=656061 RepID=D5GGE5_TUBMM|nr:uncharacterized protein GSTUM_00007341001 [Tuber melanosporum]CAZ83588.1 unnamed protein product [Tuber melanosporum]
MGVVEEVLRWGLVRVLVGLEGGAGGYRGQAVCSLSDWIAGANTGGGGRTCPSIWEGVYFMGWIWSFVECMFSWRTLRPLHHSSTSCSSTTASPTPKRFLFSRTVGRPLLGKRIRSDSTLGPSEDSSENRGLFGTFYRKRRGIQPTHRDYHHDGEEGAAQFADPAATTGAESGSSRTAYDEPILGISGGKQANVEELIPRLEEVRRGDAGDEEEGRVRAGRNEADSGDGYGDDEESDSAFSSNRSSMDSTTFRAQTPLLSSSLPYDPNQQHPHHESQALLQSSQIPVSYNTMPHLPPSPPHHQSSDHEGLFGFHPPYLAGPSSSTATITRPHRPSPSRRRPTNPEAHHFPSRRSTRKVYGVSINSLPPYLPIMWRTAALLRHLSNALIYAWAPAIVYRGRFEWWGLVILLLLAGKRGWYTVEWFGGGASRVGLAKSSIMALVLAAVVYFLGLGVWGIIH